MTNAAATPPTSAIRRRSHRGRSDSHAGRESGRRARCKGNRRAACWNVVDLEDGRRVGTHFPAKRGVVDQRLTVRGNHLLQAIGPAAARELVRETLLDEA